MTAEDIPGGLRLSHASGWNQLAEDWRVFIESQGSAAYLVERDGEILGTSAYIRYDALAWIAMMLVDPDERRTGLGARLLEAALRDLREASCVGLDATPMGAPLYRKHGFTEHSELVRTKAIVEGSRFPGGGQAVPMQAGDLAAVLLRDREVFGADRSKLLEALFRRAPECAWLVRQSGAAAGYTFGRPGKRFYQLGPIVAVDATMARDLTGSCLSRLNGKTFAIDVRRHDGEWLEFLTSAGFVEERPFTRMLLRGHAHPGILAQQYAICGPEFA